MNELIDQVAVKDTELLDWQETEVIAITAHPLGWEIIWAGEDNEPATQDPVLFKTESMREALAMAKERQEAEILRAGEQLRAAEELLPNYPDIPESSMRFVAAGRVRLMAAEYIPVPVEAAAQIAERYSKVMVVINAWDADYRLMHTSTFGKSPVEKQIAASIGEATAAAAGCAIDQKIVYHDFRAEAFARLHTLHPIDTYHEDKGPVMWWLLPVSEPPYIGSPLDCNWPGYHTHWSYLPKIELLTAEDGAEIEGF